MNTRAVHETADKSENKALQEDLQIVPGRKVASDRDRTRIVSKWSNKVYQRSVMEQRLAIR